MKYTLKFRLWHWLNALVVLIMLGTVFLRETFLNKKENAQLLMTKLSDMGNDITIEDATILAKALRENMWQWHIIFGYALAFLVVYRIILIFIDNSQRESFGSLTLHKKAVRVLYCLFYGAIVFMSVSGLAIHFHEVLSITKELVENIKEMHESIYVAILVFVPLHIAGVVIADATEENGLISTMINGKKV
ncbi:cytochrome b/b6 domain-containing protein [Sulfurimonas sp.]|uniref:cytochrome b/b6 domain-containing protein n=1 Tax=Sulfurimonas sp. TaxID=2022749 RepID=UPI0025D62F67|nr:cytochrome b/b6 domain-containing protein [Sulfurimonas sp.]MDD5157371.1 cytochrome b/b6 domain-containing protein [Sulfurimonas sp.]